MSSPILGIEYIDTHDNAPGGDQNAKWLVFGLFGTVFERIDAVIPTVPLAWDGEHAKTTAGIMLLVFVAMLTLCAIDIYKLTYMVSYNVFFYVFL